MFDEWPVVSEAEARQLAGPGAETVEAGSVTYVRGDAGLVLIIEAGDRPGGSLVDSRQGIVLRAPFPGPVEQWLRTGDGPWWGFVALPEGCLALGELDNRRGSTVDGRMRKCELVLGRPLPYELLDRVRPVAVQKPAGIDWLDAFPRGRTAALKAFITGWYADVPEAPAEKYWLSQQLPAPLRAFYRLADRRPSLYGTEMQIHPPGGLHHFLDETRLVFASDDYGAWTKSFDITGEDPVVWADESGEPERERLSGFLLQFSLVQAVFSAPFVGHAELSEEQRDRFVAGMTPVPLQPATIPEDPARFYVAPGLVAITFPFEGFQLSVASRQRSALRDLRDPGFDWDYFNG